MIKLKELLNILNIFGLSKNILNIEKINSGHINSTYKILYSDDKSYILQRLNPLIFQNPDKIMSNIKNICNILKHQCKCPEFLQVQGKNYIIKDNNVWRIYEYIKNSISYEKLDSDFKIYEFGRILGVFHKSTENADPSCFYNTIENFHNTKFYINKLSKFKLKKYSDQLNFYFKILDFADTLKNQNIPIHVTHNDVKCSNILFDKVSEKAITLIDFDTVMPGIWVNDFGDGARSACINDSSIDIKKFSSYCKGYFSVVMPEPEENYYMAMVCISAELSARYFYDYLSNENYFKDKATEEKLERSFELIKLSESIIKHKYDIITIIKNFKNASS